MRIVLTAVFIVCMGGRAYAQTVCGSALQTMPVSGATTVVITSEDHERVMEGGLPTVTDYELGIFLDGVNPAMGQPVTTIIVPKTTWTVIPNFPNCYQAKPTELLALPAAQTFRVAIQTKRSSDGAASPWSVISNPFVRPAPPPAAVSGVRVGK